MCWIAYNAAHIGFCATFLFHFPNPLNLTVLFWDITVELKKSVGHDWKLDDHSFIKCDSFTNFFFFQEWQTQIYKSTLQWS